MIHSNKVLPFGDSILESADNDKLVIPADQTCGRSSTEHVPATTILSYEQFLKRRETEKKALYQRVLKIGVLVLSSGAFFVTVDCLCELLELGNQDLYVLVGLHFITHIGLFFISSGLIILSTLPMDEVDLEELPNGVRFMLATICVIFGCVVGTLPPYSGFVNSAFGLWIFTSILIERKYRFPLVYQLCLFLVMASLTLSIVGFYYGAVGPEFFASGMMAPQLNKFIVFWENSAIGWILGIIHFSNSFGLLIHLRRNMMYIQKNTLTKNLRNKYQMDCLIMLFYIWLLLFGFTFIINGLAIMITTDLLAYFVLVDGMLLSAPVIVVYIVTPDRIFNRMARYFEHNKNRLQIDGAFMAELVASKSIMVDSLWFVPRLTDDERFSRNNIRRYFIKGIVVALEGSELYVRVDNVEEADSNWTLAFRGSEVLTVGYPPLTSDHHQSINSASFTIIRSTHANESIDRETLSLWAKDHLRVLDWNNFSDVLLLHSPRELISDEEKSHTFSLSRQCNINREMIDYFISHSWSDNAVLKCQRLREFSAQFYKKHNRYPTFWLDKVCIDQRNPTASLQVLPINIAACSKLLLICGSTYVERLWCIWELYTLFSFCREEQALERIEVLQLEGDNNDSDSDNNNNNNIHNRLANFDLNNAHCFDPNEELKLRRLIIDVGASRFENIIRKLMSGPQRKL